MAGAAGRAGLLAAEWEGDGDRWTSRSGLPPASARHSPPRWSQCLPRPPAAIPGSHTEDGLTSSPVANAASAASVRRAPPWATIRAADAALDGFALPGMPKTGFASLGYWP